MSSPVATRPASTKPVYYSARGGARSKGSDDVARSNASPPPSTALETPVPRSVHSHYARGGENEWDYRVKDGASEQTLLHDHLRLQKLGWMNREHPKRSLRGGPAIPNPTVFRRSSMGSKSGSLSSPTTTSSLDTHQHSGIWSEETQSVAFSDFTSPSFLPDDVDSYSDGHDSGNGETAAIQESTTRSFLLSSVGSGDTNLTPEAQGVAGEYSPISNGTSISKAALPMVRPPDKS